MNSALQGPGFVFGRLGGEAFGAVLPQVPLAQASAAKHGGRNQVVAA